jgi:ABC-2 type transport system permease protein
MSKTWQIFKYEYTRHVMRKRFIVAALSMPLVMVVIIGISVFAQVIQANNSPIGYIDQSGFLAHPITGPRVNSIFNKTVDLLPYSTEDDAQAALKSGKIQAYYVIEPDYLTTSAVRLVSLKTPSSQIQNQFTDFIKANLLTGQSAQVANRLSSGSNMVIRSADGSREMGQEQWFNILLPILTGLLFMILTLSTGGYLMQAVVEEKENRTMEIMVTSVSADQLMLGKIMGNLCVGLTQMLIWITFGVIGGIAASYFLGWNLAIQFSGESVLILIFSLLPAFIMISALETAIGATVTEAREAQSVTGLFTLPIVMPYWFSSVLISNPNSPLAVGLSYFPLTSPVTLTLRAAFTQIPTLQLAAVVAIQVVCAAAAIWFAARAFRIGMLSYGKRISFRQVVRPAAKSAS